jgi:TonB family protein
MTHFFIYLIQSTICMGILYVVYWIFLRNDTFHMVNRFYLLLAALLSVLVPLFKIDLNNLGPVRSVMIYLDPIIITPEKIGNTTSSSLDWVSIAGIVYLTGVIIFLARFIFQLVQLWTLARRFGIRRSNGITVVFTDRTFSPFSFFNLIFLNTPEREEDLQPILEHEQVHVHQRHSVDLLVVELVTLLQWFNPFIWLTGRSLKTIHEFLADQGALKTGISKADYQQLLLDRAMGIQVNNLTNNFNVSLIKKRIIMMTKTSSTAIARLKLAVAFPALFAVLILISGGSFNQILAQAQKQETKKETAKPAVADPTQASAEPEIFTVVEKMPEYTGGQDALIDFLRKNIKYPEAALKQGIEGTVYLTFVVRASGDVSNVKVLRGIDKACDTEAVRVVKLMPKWKPGEYKGKPVNVQFNLPIKFKLDKDEKKKGTP